MAGEIDLMSRLAELVEISDRYELKACPYYSAAGDCIFVFFENTTFYADHCHGFLTIYRSMDDDRIVGAVIGRVSELVENSGERAAYTRDLIERLEKLGQDLDKDGKTDDVR